MDRLPDLVIDGIVSYLPDERLSRFATLSSEWQRAVERRTFSSLSINDRDEDMGQLAQIVLPKRGAYLRRLEFTVLVPFDEPIIKPRNAKQARFSKYFTAAVQRLFQTLADGIPDDRRRLHLELGRVASFSDYRNGASTRFLRQRIYLVGHGQQLPLVPCVSHLTLISDASTRRVALRTIADLVKRLPNLTHATLAADIVEVSHWAGENAILYQEDRGGLAAALVDSELVSRACPAHVTLSIEWQDPYLLPPNPQTSFPDCTNSLAYDPLSVAIRTWSHSLVSLDISGVLDPSIFWPKEKGVLELPASPWPRLKSFHAKLGLATPTGKWYFDVRPGTSRRNVPCDDTMQPLIESWATSLGSMRMLEEATITFKVDIEISEPGFTPSSVEHWAIGFQSPYTSLDPIRRPWETNLTADDLHSPKLFYQNLGSWRPWSSTIEKLHTMVNERFRGKHLIEYEVDPFNKVKKIRCE